MRLAIVPYTTRRVVGHDEKISEKENAILKRFSLHIRKTATIMMPIRDALGEGSAGDIEAFNSLIARGWILTNAAVQWNRNDVCMICGEGLRIAQQMVNE